MTDEEIVGKALDWLYCSRGAFIYAQAVENGLLRPLLPSDRGKVDLPVLFLLATKSGNRKPYRKVVAAALSSIDVSSDGNKEFMVYIRETECPRLNRRVKKILLGSGQCLVVATKAKRQHNKE